MEKKTTRISVTGSSRKKAFTLFEVLVAVAILAVGISQVFRIFFSSLSAIQYMHNRSCANLALDRKIWDLEKRINQKGVSGQYTETKLEGDNPTFSFVSTASKLSGFGSIYRLDLKASWNEAGKDVSLRRVTYIRKGS
jgi:prepilin-type N-terminal cleavage/methylation domain-containing protein